VANLASRVFALLARIEGPLQAEPERPIVEATRSALHLARGAYGALEYREVVRLASEVASLCNRRMQEAKPWEDPGSAAARALLFTVVKALRAVAVMLAPVLPVFCDRLCGAFGQPHPRAWPQVARLDAKQVAKLIAVSADAVPQPVSKAASPAETASKASAQPAPVGVIGYDDFAKVELRVAQVRSVEPVPKADKLLKLAVDVGEPEPRTIVAGIAQAYPDPQQLVGKRIVVVANLAARPLRGITSQGMLLAAGEPPHLEVVTVGDAIAPGTRVK
jgi:methionyl-tRNA synthetase